MDDKFFDFEKLYLQYLQKESSEENDPCMKAFKAVNEKNSKILSNALDISGVVGTTCKHGIPVKFLNIKTGERLVYSLFLLNNILDKFGSQINVKNKLNETSLQLKVKDVWYAVSVFHAYTHEASCHKDFGHIWKDTKTTTSSHHKFILSLVLDHFAETRIQKIGTIKSSWKIIKDDLINPKYQPLPTVSSDIIFEKIILKEKIENEIKKYNNHKIRKTLIWAVLKYA
ncbi:hypothetical protein RirG_220460 [Rhizophagus irregularis DAOM 197198w]|nr:hypothetical protein RirG_220460 [Rhizophagus irregularis DAOM 197198w]